MLLSAAFHAGEGLLKGEASAVNSQLLLSLYFISKSKKLIHLNLHVEKKRNTSLKSPVSPVAEVKMLNWSKAGSVRGAPEDFCSNSLMCCPAAQNVYVTYVTSGNGHHPWITPLFYNIPPNASSPSSPVT